MAKLKLPVKDHNWLFEKPIAHRGLHGGAIIENSLAAYERAIQKGYNIEIDVPILADGELVVFHDNTLRRIFGEGIEIRDLTYEQLCKYSLPFVNEKIPTFQEVLDYVAGRTGLLIEVKTYVRTKVCERMWEILSEYNGHFCIQSFSPLALLWFRRHAPEVPLGILGSVIANAGIYWAGRIKPEFISYEVASLNDRKFVFLRARAPRILSWTVSNPILEQRARRYAENIIFEGYEADPNAKSHITIAPFKPNI